MPAYTYESLAVEAAAVGFTAAKIALPKQYGKEVKSVMGTVETDQIRFTTDGTTPTSSVGHLLNKGDVVYVTEGDIENFLAIKVSASATLKCSYLD